MKSKAASAEQTECDSLLIPASQDPWHFVVRRALKVITIFKTMVFWLRILRANLYIHVVQESWN